MPNIVYTWFFEMFLFSFTLSCSSLYLLDIRIRSFWLLIIAGVSW